MFLEFKRKNSLTAAIIMLCLFCGVIFPQNKITPVEKQAHEIMKFFTNSEGCEKLFTKEFLAQVPKERLLYIFKYYFDQCGACTKITTVKAENDFSAKFDFYFEKNSTVAVTLAAETKEPYLINGLFFGNPVVLAASFDDLIKEFKKLPGETSLYAVKFINNKLNTIAEQNADNQLAIGSTFKLYILSELLRSINKGERKWSDVVQLQEDCVSLPSGFLHSWHTGTNMTIESLASLMISISDNTATDNLLKSAGRENVEKMLVTAGHSKPELNIPFLATLEMFKMKGNADKEFITKFISSPDKKKFIREELSKISRESFSAWIDPFYIDKVEWFASCKDLCNVMNWIRINSENEKDNRTRNILSINPGLGISTEKWSYIGYKGGSEPGVMNMTYLLRSAKGEWFALSCGWNNVKAPIDEAKFAGLVGRAIQLLEN